MEQIFEVALQWVWIVPLYTLVAGVLALLWSPGAIEKTGPRPSGYLSLLATLLAFSHSVLALVALWDQPVRHLSITWFQAAGVHVTLDLTASAIAVAAMAVITGTNALAQVFAIGYLEMDWGWARFFSLLGLFEAGTCVLMLCDSAFFSYVLLELLTLATYLLVGFWFAQPLVVTGARDAFLTKRVGDLALLLGIIALLPVAGTWNFEELALWATTADLTPWAATLLGLALVAGPAGKCAQLPLHLWLDEAMEAPLPATILRNAVVVQAGAWVLVKLQPVINLSPIAVTVEASIGIATAVGCAAIAIAQVDVKRVLSYLTSSAMGIAFVQIATGQGTTALAGLFAFGMAMGLLVMASGSVVWNCITQDLRQMGGLWGRRPVAGLGFAVGAAGAIALPPLGGFWTTFAAVDHLWPSEAGLAIALLVADVLAAIALARALGLMFFGQIKPMTERAPEVSWTMTLPTAIALGFVLHVPLLLGLTDWFAETWAAALAHWPVAIAVVASSLAGLAIGAIGYWGAQPKPLLAGLGAPVRDFFARDFYTPDLYRLTVVNGVGALGRALAWFDRFIIDGIANAMGAAALMGGQGLRYNTSGRAQFYALSILSSLLLFGVLVGWPVVAESPLALNFSF